MVHAIYKDADRIYVITTYVINSIVIRGLIKKCSNIMNGLSANKQSALDEYRMLLRSFGAKADIELEEKPDIPLRTPYTVIIETMLEYKKPEREDVVTLLQEGNMLLNLQRYDEAIKNYFDKIIDLYKNKISNDMEYLYALNNKGWAYYNLRQYDKAIECYDEAWQLSKQQAKNTEIIEYNIKLLATEILEKDCNDMNIRDISNELKKLRY